MTAIEPLAPYVFPEVSPGGIACAVEAAGDPNVLSPGWAFADQPGSSERATTGARNEAAWLEACVPGVGALLARPDWVAWLGTWTDRSSANTHLLGAGGSIAALHRATAPSGVAGQLRLTTGLDGSDLLGLVADVAPWSGRDMRPAVALRASLDPVGALALASVIDLARAWTRPGPVTVTAEDLVAACRPVADPHELRSHVGSVAEIAECDLSLELAAAIAASLAGQGLLVDAGGGRYGLAPALAALAELAANITGGLALQGARRRGGEQGEQGEQGELGITRLVAVHAGGALLVVRLVGPDQVEVASVGTQSVVDTLARELATLTTA